MSEERDDDGLGLVDDAVDDLEDLDLEMDSNGGSENEDSATGGTETSDEETESEEADVEADSNEEEEQDRKEQAQSESASGSTDQSNDSTKPESESDSEEAESDEGPALERVHDREKNKLIHLNKESMALLTRAKGKTESELMITDEAPIEELSVSRHFDPALLRIAAKKVNSGEITFEEIMEEVEQIESLDQKYE